MRVRIVDGGTTAILGSGDAVDADDVAADSPAPSTLLAAVRQSVVGPTVDDDGGRRVVVDCEPPGRGWQALANPSGDGAPVDRLVAAARSRGERVPGQRALAAAERALRAVRVESTPLAEHRRRVAQAGEDVDRLREEVATLRGRLQARREVGADTDGVAEELEAAGRRLAAAETDAVAARQAYEAARADRRGRGSRDRRLRLQDRVANRRREVRRALLERVADPFERAVRVVPGTASLSLDPVAVSGDPVTAALAAVRIADLRAPVVDATGRFDSAVEAAATLDAPVVRV